MTRPNFFIVGAPKCGTTALYTYLAAHPQIFMPKVKEPMYFRGNSPYTSEAQYLDLFRDAGDAPRIGEATPSYLRDPQATAAIHAFAPDAKIIIMLRNHADMIHSYYWQNRMTGREQTASLAESLAQQQADPASRPANVPFYLRLVYAEHVERYFDLFGREQVQVIIFDDFRRDTPAVYRDTLHFLGVDDRFMPDFPKVNAGKGVRSPLLQRLTLALGLNVRNLRRLRMSGLAQRLDALLPVQPRQSIMTALRRVYYSDDSPPPLDAALRRELQDAFRADTDRLSELLGRDLSFWYRA